MLLSVLSLHLDILYDFLTTLGRSEHVPTPKTKPYTKTLKETMRRKSEILSKAQALWEVGMIEPRNRFGYLLPSSSEGRSWMTGMT